MHAGRSQLAVVLACPGLDRTRRGFETFARECFDALRREPGAAIMLVKGSGERRPGEVTVPTPSRDGRAVRALARLASREPFVLEHVAFAVLLVPWLLVRRPDVVYFSEWHVGRVLSAARRLRLGSFALVLCNGGLVSRGYEHFDLVQQLVPGAIEYVVAHGGAPDNQTLLPLGVAVPPSPPAATDRRALRRVLGLPEERTIVLSAGAINRQKRIDYLIEEVASISEPRPFLLMLGEPEAESTALRRLARERLGERNYDIRVVPQTAMTDYYRAADAFVLASLWESFGRVLVEAQSHGLPCLAHDYPVMRWVLGDDGSYADLREPGAVVEWLQSSAAADLSEEARQRRWQSAARRFGWDVLAPRYVAMLREAAETPRRP